jgi:hypothetical protein
MAKVEGGGANSQTTTASTPMSPSQQRVNPLTHTPDCVLPTASPLLGVLIEPTQRRVVAVSHIPTGTVLCHLDGLESATPTRYSVQLDAGVHLDPFDIADPDARLHARSWMYLNHSCAPNAAIVGRTLIALGDIAAGDGVTFDYNTTEWELAEPFSCHCASPNCVGTVRGARFARRAITPP